MAKRAAGAPNKSEAIRNYKKDNPAAGPKEVAAALAKDGLKVTPGFVSTLLSNDRRKSRKGRRNANSKSGRQAAGGDAVQALMQAKRLADQMGGVAKARAALDALARILGE